MVKTGEGRLAGRDRWLMVAGAAGLLALLATARLLPPNPLGLGTHQHLGLPPCTFLVLVGRPCPSCGMTTAWACLVRGRLLRAVAANAGGTVLAALAVAAVPWLIVSAARGRWLGRPPDSTTSAVIAAAIAAMTLAQWVWRLAVG